MRRAFGHDAVMQDVALHEPRQPRRASARGSSRSACRRAGRPGRRRSAPSAPPPPHGRPGRCARRARRWARWRASEKTKRAAKPGSAAVGQPVVVADPRRRCARPARRAASMAGDQRHSRSIQSSTRRTASGGGAGIAAIAQVAQPAEAVQGVEPERGRRPRAATADRRDSGATAPELPWARSSPMQQALAGRRIARPGVGRHGEEAARRAVAQGQGIEAGGEQPAAEFAALAGRRLGDARGRGRVGTERMGRAPAVKGSPDRRMSEATSVIFSVLFWSDGASTGRSRGWRSLPDPDGHGDASGRPRRGPQTGPLNRLQPAPQIHHKGRPEWVPGHSLLGGGFYEPRVDVQFALAAGF